MSTSRAPFAAEAAATQAGRRRGVVKRLRWLSELPGDTWQQRWLTGGAEKHLGATWAQLPAQWLRQQGEAAACDPENLTSGLLMLICGDGLRVVNRTFMPVPLTVPAG